MGEFNVQQAETLAAAFRHYDLTSYAGIRSPDDFRRTYRNLGVIVDAWRAEFVDVHKYRINRAKDAADYRIDHDEAQTEQREFAELLRRWLAAARPTHGPGRSLLERVRRWRSEARMLNVFVGKGYPKDIAMLLTLATLVGRLRPIFFDLQDYCNLYIGVDCSGFVNNYFIATGRGHDDRHSRNRAISFLARPPRRLNAIPDNPMDHIVTWTKPLDKGTNPGEHIALIQGWESRADNRLRIIESAASLRGLSNSVYRLASGPDRNGIFHFFSEDVLRGSMQRLILALPRES